MDHCHDIIEIIDYYDLRNLVFYIHSVNVERCAKF